MESLKTKLGGIEYEKAQNWHPKGFTAEEIQDRNRILVRQDPNPTPERIHRIVATSRPIR